MLEKLNFLIPTEFDSKSQLFLRRVRYFLLVVPFGILIQLFFVIQMDLYQHENCIKFIISTSLFISALSILIFYWKKNFNLSLLVFFLPSMVSVYALIFFTGGIKAPGCFWLSMFPILGGFFLGKKGIYLGAIYTFFSIVSFYVLEYVYNISIFFTRLESYQRDKELNFYVFSLFLLIFVLFFVGAYERSEKMLADKKNQVELLLRVLIHDVANPLTVIMLRAKRISKSDNSKLAKEGFSIIDMVMHISDQLDQIRLDLCEL